MAAKRPRRPSAMMVISAIVVLAGIAAFIAVPRLEDAKQLASGSAAMNLEAIGGPPCPEIAPAVFQAEGYKAEKEFAFNGVTFMRQVGDVDCRAVEAKQKGGAGFTPVCQFSSPSVIAVKLADGSSRYFNPGVGVPATVVVENGQVSCLTDPPK